MPGATMMTTHSKPAGPRGWILGAGAHGREVATIWSRAEPERELIFLDDNAALWHTEVSCCKVMGGFQTLADSARPDDKAIIAIGNNYNRMDIAKRFTLPIPWGNVIDPSAVVMPGSTLGIDILVASQAVIATGTRIGNHAIVNTGAIIEHDSVVEEGASI